MRFKSLLSVFSVIIILGLLLSSCNLLQLTGTLPTEDPNQLGTMAAATVSAYMTQQALATLLVQPTGQPGATNTPMLINTPQPTATLQPPTATVQLPTATKTPIPIPCNAAEFKGDITIQDGTTVYTGDVLLKTWRVKNVGTCTWTKDYKIFFFGGNQMEAASSVAFPGTVKPGESVDLSVKMTAPSKTGSFSGSWKLKAANSEVFGVGDSFTVPMTINIKVKELPEPKDPNTVYDFVGNYCDAKWRTNAGSIDCPSMEWDFKKGSIMRSYNPVLEENFHEDEGTLITIPAEGGDGLVRGKYPAIKIKNGYAFAAILACADKQEKCSVTFELLYSYPGETKMYSINSWTKEYGDGFFDVYEDLSSLAGEEVNLYLAVSSDGNSAEDVAMWVAARITQ